MGDVFKRGIEPKASMGTGLPRCSECGKVLKEYETGVCLKCRNKDDAPLFKRRELWASPFSPLIVIGCGIYYIGFGIFWFMKWCYYSTIRPFSYSPKICEKGFHKYRPYSRSWESNTYKCNICGQEKTISDD